MTFKRYRDFFFLFTLSAAFLCAAPKLRLSSTAVGPISITAGTNGPTQSVAATNAGDGTFTLTATSTVTWLTPTVTPNATGAVVLIGLNTASLAKGVYTGFVTISDPKTIDAPQTVSVTVQIGGGIPDTITLYAPTNGHPASTTFTTNGALSAKFTSPVGVALALTMGGSGSFQFSIPYSIQATAGTNTAPGTYTGSVAISGSSFAGDNKTVPITVNVTNQAIASVSPTALNLRITQGTIKQTNYIAVNNSGVAALTLSGASATTTSGGTWLTASTTGNLVAVVVDPTNLAAGNYQGVVSIASNAANALVNVPVQLNVSASGPPFAAFHGVVDNAFASQPGDPVALGDIVAVFGDQLTDGTTANASALPLPTTLAGATVFVNNVAAPLYFASNGQINFQIPFEATTGDATIRVDRGGQTGNTVSINIARSQPRILTINSLPGNYGIIVNTDGTFPIPTTPGFPSHPAKIGDTLVIYALGLGPTTPAVTSGLGAPAVEPLARVSSIPVVYFGGGLFSTSAPPFFAGLTPGFVGLYQVNVTIPPSTPTGPSVGVFFGTPEGQTNHVNIAIQ